MSWLDQARKRNQRLGAIAWDGGLGIPRRLDLRNSGYLSRLRLTSTLTGAYAVAGPTAVDAFGLYGGALNRLTVTANSIGNLFDCSGFMAAIISAIDAHRNYGSNLLTNQANVVTAAPGTSAFSDAWYLDIPIAVALLNKPTPLGLFQTALNSQETSLEVRFSLATASAGLPGSGVYVPGAGATGGATGGNVDIQQIYFDPIADPASQPILGFIHRWREFQAPLTADGDTEIRLQPSNYYMTVIAAIVTGASGALALDATHLTRMKLLYGANLAPFDEPEPAIRARQSQNYGFALPAGVYAMDFFTETMTERDFINAAATTDLRIVLNLSGATYSGGAYAKIAVEELVPLIIPQSNTPGVQGAAA